jgi:hypothetical protein
MATDNTDKMRDDWTMSDSTEYDRSRAFEPDQWPHEPPAELLEALDRAAARLCELDARGVQISLGIGTDGGPRASLSQQGRACEIDSSSLLKLVCGSKLRVPRVSVS